MKSRPDINRLALINFNYLKGLWYGIAESFRGYRTWGRYAGIQRNRLNGKHLWQIFADDRFDTSL